MGYGGGSNLTLNNNPNRRAVGAGAAKLPPPTKGFARIWIDVSSTAGKDKTGQVHPTDAEIEKAVFARFGLSAETDANVSRLKERLGTTDNPFDFVKTTGDYTTPFRANGKYKIPVDVEKSLYAKLSGKAVEVKQQIEAENRAQSQTFNPNETVAGRTGYDTANYQRAALDAKYANGAGNQSSVNNKGANKGASNIANNQSSAAASEITVSLPTNSTLPLADRITGGILRQALDPNYDYIWGDKMPDYVAEAKTKGFQPEILSAQTNGDQIEVRVRLSARDAQTLAQINGDFQTTKANIDQARSKARTETNNMFLDQAKVVWNAGVNIVEGTVNQAIDAALTNGGTNPIPLMNPFRPRADFSSAKADYRSEMMRRDINGKVDGDGIRMGQAVETGVTFIAPLVVGKVMTPSIAPQTLRSLGALENTGISAAQIALDRQTAAQSIKEARNLLRDTGLPRSARNEIINSFDLKTFRIERVSSTRTEFRVFDDFSAKLKGRYISTDLFPSQTDTISNLALLKNSATRLGTVTIPEGSVVFTGRVAPQLRFNPGLTGGAKQTFLTGDLNSYIFKEIYVGNK